MKTADWIESEFERLAQSPEGIPKLREFVLQLAVQGKLVAQDSKDEPASELLKRIAAQKEQLVKDGKIKKSKPLPDIEEDEIPFEIPKSWEWVRLGEVCSYIQRGKGPKYAKESNIPVINQKCIQWTGFNLTDCKFITPDSLEKYGDERFLQQGDLMWNSTGTGTIGRVLVFNDADKETYEKIVVDSHVTIVRPLLVASIYLQSWLASPYVYGTIEDNASGSTNQIELGTMWAKEHLTPIPPLAEQHRIVAKVDELMALCDELEAKQTAKAQTKEALNGAALHHVRSATTPADLASATRFYIGQMDTLTDVPQAIPPIRETILQLAVQGKLVPQDPNDEPASELLKRIAAEKEQLVKDGKIKKSKPLPDIKEDEISFETPMGREPFRMGSIVDIIGGSQPPKNTFIYEEREGYTRLVQIRDFKSDSNLTYVPNEKANRPFNKDDIMIGRYGPPVFQILRGLEGTYNVALMKAVPNENALTKDFLFHLLSEPRIQNLVVSESKRTAGQSGVRKPLINNFVAALPPLAEQKRIVAKVDELMTLCDQLEVRLTTAQDLNQQLTQAILTTQLNGN